MYYYMCVKDFSLQPTSDYNRDWYIASPDMYLSFISNL